ncbi:MAG: hypothetical protein OXH75_14660 [Acidobacteria bacterium]|nr:hypothetical protein [Acidobacteriota bacterium]
MRPTEAIATRPPYFRRGPAGRFRHPWRTTLTLLVAVVGAASPIAAQETGSLEELSRSGALQEGDRIYVTIGDGRRLKGTLLGLSPTMLAITKGDAHVTVPAADVRRIERGDSLANGVLIGAGIGAALTCMAHRGCGSSPIAVTTHVLFDHGAVGLLLLGAGVGALVDARWHRTLYDVPFGTAQLSIDPIVSRERAGAGLTVKW